MLYYVDGRPMFMVSVNSLGQLRLVTSACEQLLFVLAPGKLVYVLLQPSVGIYRSRLFHLLPVAISTAAPHR